MVPFKSRDHFSCRVTDCTATRIPSWSITGCHPRPIDGLVAGEEVLPLSWWAVCVNYGPSQHHGLSIYLYLPTPSAHDTRSIFQQNLTERIIWLLLFPRVLLLCEMQSASPRIWTHIVVYIFYDDNHYTTSISEEGIEYTLHNSWQKISFIL